MHEDEGQSPCRTRLPTRRGVDLGDRCRHPLRRRPCLLPSQGRLHRAAALGRPSIRPGRSTRRSIHELAHLSESRTGWDDRKQGYALGELVAEIASCYVAAELGIPQGEDLGNHAAYLQNWLEALKERQELHLQGGEAGDQGDRLPVGFREEAGTCGGREPIVEPSGYILGGHQAMRKTTFPKNSASGSSRRPGNCCPDWEPSPTGTGSSCKPGRVASCSTPSSTGTRGSAPCSAASTIRRRRGNSLTAIRSRASGTTTTSAAGRWRRRSTTFPPRFAACSFRKGGAREMDTTVVMFRTDREGVVFALFPELPADDFGRSCTAYERRRSALCRRLRRLHLQQRPCRSRRIPRPVRGAGKEGIRPVGPSPRHARDARASSPASPPNGGAGRREEQLQETPHERPDRNRIARSVKLYMDNYRGTKL